MQHHRSSRARRSLTSRLHHWLRHLWLDALPDSAGQRRQTRLRPQLEQLEDRTVPVQPGSLDVGVTALSVAVPGGPVPYTISLTNNGTVPTLNVSLVSDFPSSTTFVSQVQTSGPAFSASVSSGSPANVTYAIASLSPNASATFNVVVQVAPGTANATVLTESASVTTTTTLLPTAVTSASVNTTVYTFGPISVTNPGTQSSTEGNSASLSISATDHSGGTLTYAASGLPAGLHINPSTGAVSGTVGIGAAASGPYTTTVTASDGPYSGETTFTWIVGSPVSLTNPGTHTNNEGDAVSLSLSATDSISGSTLTYAAAGLPTGLKINTSTGAITGTVAVGAAAKGPTP